MDEEAINRIFQSARKIEDLNLDELKTETQLQKGLREAYLLRAYDEEGKPLGKLTARQQHIVNVVGRDEVKLFDRFAEADLQKSKRKFGDLVVEYRRQKPKRWKAEEEGLLLDLAEQGASRKAVIEAYRQKFGSGARPPKAIQEKYYRARGKNLGQIKTFRRIGKRE